MHKTQLLRRILHNTDSFRKKMGFSCVADPPPTTDNSSLILKLPMVPDIQPQLLEAGIPLDLAQALYRIYCDKADLRRKCSLRHLSRLANMPGMPNDKVARIFSTAFQKQLEAWRDQTASYACARHSQSRLNGERTSRTSFKSESVPLLETYFKRNAYPSASDRSMLAVCTGMAPRQIEVWFQNHRNRRKHDQSLNRLSEPFPLADLLSDVAKYSAEKRPVVETPLEPSLQVPVASWCSILPSLPPTKPNPLNLPAPRHAFPAPYPPTCAYDPFPGKELGQCQLPSVQWMRSPPPDRPKRKRLPENSADHDLPNEFASRLHLHRGNGHKRHRDSLESEEPAIPWRSPTYVYLYRGRHPASVRNQQVGQSSIRSSIPEPPCRPTKRLKSSQPSPPRSRCTSFSSISSCSSSNTLATPINSPTLETRKLARSPCHRSPKVDLICPNITAFEAYGGSAVAFGFQCLDTL